MKKKQCAELPPGTPAVIFPSATSSTIFRDPWFCSGLDATRWPTIKPGVDLELPIPTSWLNDINHKSVRKFEGHVTQWKPATDCSANQVGLNILGAQ